MVRGHVDRVAGDPELAVSLIITGACRGADAIVAIHAALHFPKVRQLIIVPGCKKFIDRRVLSLDADFIHMASPTSFADRNAMIVERSDRVDAFWNGKEKGSGTFMTMKMAQRAGKLGMTISI